MKPQPRTLWIDLKVKRGGFDGFLFLAGEFSQTIGEGIGNAEFHNLLLYVKNFHDFIAEVVDDLDGDAA